jgi:hypothetical protein
MNYFKFLLLILLGIVCAIALPSCFSAANSSSSPTIETIVYPQDANLVDVRKYGAKGDGTTDDTAAIRQAVKENLQQHKTLFFPAGTYLISDSIEWKRDDGMFYAFLTFQGEGTGRTIFKLKDNALGFSDPKNRKPMIRPGSYGFGGTGGGNMAHNNYIFDVTINTGKDNPGAIGVDFTASNTGSMENVAIASDDGKGAVGLELTREVGPCLIKKVTIKGFDVGIKGRAGLISVTLEDIRLENQNVVGIDNENLVLAIRHLTSINSVPALKNTGDWKGPVVLVDSELRGGSPQKVAIENTSNLFVRNVKVDGYETALKSEDKSITGNYIEEFVSGKPLSLFDSPLKTLNLSVEETPEFIDNDLNNWANVEKYGAKRDDDLDDTDAIQRAIDSGKTIIYFPQGTYKLDRPVTIRGNVRKLVGFQSIFAQPKTKDTVLIRFENNQHPVILERFNFFNGGAIENAASQPVVIRHVIQPQFLTTSNTGTWFIEDVATERIKIGKGQKVYARQLNCESPPPEPLLTNDGGSVWILGYKTEFGNTIAANFNAGKTEILGGLFYPAQGMKDQNIPLLINQNASVSAIYREITFGSTYTIHVEETRDRQTKILKRDAIGQGNMVAVPLYVGYKP